MNKMNTLAFVNFLLVKFFPTLICQNFPPSKICAIRYQLKNINYRNISSKISKKVAPVCSTKTCVCKLLQQQIGIEASSASDSCNN